MDGGAWWAAVPGVAASQTRLSGFAFTFHFHALEKEWQPTPVFLPGESQGHSSGKFWTKIQKVQKKKKTQLLLLESWE